MVDTAVAILSEAVDILNSKSPIDDSQSNSLSAYKSSSLFYSATKSALISARSVAMS